MELGTLKGGRYRIVGVLGSGGMSQIFEAFDESLKRPVALKMLHPHLARDPVARARFSKEAEATARLKHPHIVEIYDVAAMDSPEAFIVTELIQGTTLRDALEAHRFTPPTCIALAVMDGLAQALECAHLADVVHRDLKPENVMISEDGTLKLMDFGIARILDDKSQMTMTGALVGSPLHMAPEVIDGQKATAASDIFSAGTIFYWLVCGKPPFVGATATKTMRNIVETAPEDPLIDAPFLSRAEAQLIRQCLEKNPSDRPQNGGELRRKIQALIAEEQGDPGKSRELLGRFMAQPESFRDRMIFQEVGRLLGQAELELSRGELCAPQAISLVGRAMALSKDDRRTQKLLDAIDDLQARTRKKAVVRQILRASALASAIALGLCWFFGTSKTSTKSISSNKTQAIASTESPSVQQPSTEETESVATPGNQNAIDTDSLAPWAQATVTHSTSNETPSKDTNSSTLASPSASTLTDQKPSNATDLSAQPARTPKKKKSVSKASVAEKKVATSEKETPATEPSQPIEQKTGTISVVVHHDALGMTWGKIFIDGQHVNTNSPTWSGELSVGHHVINADAPCCIPQSKNVEVTIGGTNPPVIFRLKSRPALLSVDSPKPCEIWLKGIRRASCAESMIDPVAVPLPKGALKGPISFRLVQQGQLDVELSDVFEVGKKKVVAVDDTGRPKANIR